MVLTLSVILIVNAVFAGAVWPRFTKRIAADARSTDATGGRTAFFRVHLLLIVAALTLAAASLMAGVAGLMSLA